VFQASSTGPICTTDFFAGIPEATVNRACREHASSPATVPCPSTGRQLKIATLEVAAAAICPSCANHGQGGFVSFEGDLRMAYAYPRCLQLVWLAGV
jgi:hypothetical protein